MFTHQTRKQDKNILYNWFGRSGGESDGSFLNLQKNFIPTISENKPYNFFPFKYRISQNVELIICFNFYY